MLRARRWMALLFLLSALPPGSFAASSARALSTIDHEFLTAEDAISSIRSLGLALQQQKDRRALFPLIYALTIESASRKLAHGEFRNPDWVNSLVVNYANLYRATILAELSGNRAKVPAAWRLEFEYVEENRGDLSLAPEMRTWSPDLDVIYGIHVHIARDLVEALLITPTNFKNESQRADFLLITSALKDVMPRIWKVFTGYASFRYSAPALGQSIMASWISDLRAQAWHRASLTQGMSALEKAAFLERISNEVFVRSKSYGSLLPMLPRSIP